MHPQYKKDRYEYVYWLRECWTTSANQLQQLGHEVTLAARDASESVKALL